MLRLREGGLQFITDTNPLYDPLHYVLMFPFGDHGWTYDMLNQSGKKISIMDWASSRLHIRANGLNLDFFGRLYLQYVCDQYAKMEGQRLNYLRTHQSEIRAESYQNLQDALSTHDHNTHIGTKIILPSSFIGGPRHMGQL